MITFPSSQHRRGVVAFTVLAAGLITAAAANAHTITVNADGVPSVKVSYADLNLQSDQGNKELYGRIAAAARTVCGSDLTDSRDLNSLAYERKCESTAIEHAVENVHSTKLAALARVSLRHG
jgi:UrcA family protein